MELGSIAGKSRDGGCFVARGCLVRFGKYISADIQLGIDFEAVEGYGIVLVCLDMNKMGAVGEKSECGCNLLDNVPIRL
jgi:hypothetical protein